MNILYLDGHAAVSKGSQLKWGQWYGVFSGTTIPGTTVKVDSAVSTAALDDSEVKPD
jgi:hypothetical protein